MVFVRGPYLGARTTIDTMCCLLGVRRIAILCVRKGSHRLPVCSSIYFVRILLGDFACILIFSASGISALALSCTCLLGFVPPPQSPALPSFTHHPLHIYLDGSRS